MTFEEGMERLKERHEALTQSIARPPGLPKKGTARFLNSRGGHPCPPRSGEAMKLLPWFR
jgi:hypothetical protein